MKRGTQALTVIRQVIASLTFSESDKYGTDRQILQFKMRLGVSLIYPYCCIRYCNFVLFDSL